MQHNRNLPEHCWGHTASKATQGICGECVKTQTSQLQNIWLWWWGQGAAAVSGVVGKSLKGAQRGSQRTFVSVISIFLIALNRKDSLIRVTIHKSRTLAKFSWTPSVWMKIPVCPVLSYSCGSRAGWDIKLYVWGVIAFILGVWQKELPSADC